MRKDEKTQAFHRDGLIDAVVFVLLLTAVSVVTLQLFHTQALASLSGGDQSESDMKAYILEMQGLDSGYSFPYPVFFKIAAFLNLFATPVFAVALATMLLNSLAVVFVKLALNGLVLPECENCEGVLKKRWLTGILLSLVSVSLFFISMLYPPEGIYLPGIRFRYAGVFTANPFHNATYMAARPFAILAFLWYAKLLPVYEKGIRTRQNRDGAAPLDYVLFSVFLLVATMTKPSFTIVLVGAAGLIMLYRLCRSGFRHFIPTLQLGLCFLPTFLDLLYQYSGVFVPEEGTERGIGFTLGEIWGYYCDNIPLSIGLAMGFPLLVLVLNFKELKRNELYRFSWQIYLLSLAMAFFLYEKGFRKVDFNFSWGYMYGIFFGHFGALTVLLMAQMREAQPDNAGKRQGKQKVFYRLCLGAQWLAYLWHVACGLYYFMILQVGGTYY